MINLKQQTNKYRVTFEDSYYHAGLIDRADPDFPIYYQIIPGKFGEIYWHSDNRLAVQVNSGKLMSRVSKLKGVETFVEGDGEGIYLFSLDMLDTIAEIIKARRRRQVSEKERERLAQIGFKLGWKKRATSTIL